MSALCLLRVLTSRQFERHADPNSSDPLPVGCFVIADGHRSCRCAARAVGLFSSLRGCCYRDQDEVCGWSSAGERRGQSPTSVPQDVVLHHAG